MRRDRAEPVDAEVQPGRRFRLNGKKDILKDMQSQKATMIEVTGLVRRLQVNERGVPIAGGRVRIGGGQPQAPMCGEAIGQRGDHNEATPNVQSWDRCPLLPRALTPPLKFICSQRSEVLLVSAVELVPGVGMAPPAQVLQRVGRRHAADLSDLVQSRRLRPSPSSARRGTRRPPPSDRRCDAAPRLGRRRRRPVDGTAVLAARDDQRLGASAPPPRPSRSSAESARTRSRCR